MNKLTKESIKYYTVCIKMEGVFQTTVNYYSLLDMSYQGPKLTWSNKRDNDLICKKLDRILMNDLWLQNIPSIILCF